MEVVLRLLDEDKDALYYVSQVLGWIYFVAWSISFYGQVIENFRRHSVSGLNFDFEIYNLVGFTTYTIYNVRGYLDDNLGTGTVQIQDIFFGAHALLLTLVTIFQILYYFNPNDKDQKGYVNLDEFIQFYQDSCGNRLTTVWDNINNMGYDGNCALC